ncbi:DEAD/DEAH box helicase [Williamsia sterculiae]|uniref:ATP-dependent RNA helicase HelY n=1 Tax=Williamsia sterculiae TaxID=1344003 RepID=A0A1N7EMY3_9NOCA|nr:DEAD/DEAH box helicase [Williamsia sterculiae]SIR89412.1 ATP-dependent RNA helicase HelY [Williamsia sterculiae]
MSSEPSLSGPVPDDTRPDSHPELARFAASLSFGLDEFQRAACAALEDGHGVLVCAPTGAGKTVVGEFAVHLALMGGTKCFYTTPIKALSNQKYADLVAVHGVESVGLLTGDSSINADAPIVVMTTEVVRNMIYANSSALNGLSYVVMDEVHYLADRFRGAVWEEVILHLDPAVRLVSLSATVSNAEEFGDWIQAVRGDTTVIVDEHRPVPLWQHMLVGNRMFDLFDGSAPNDGRREVNPALARYIRQREVVDLSGPGRGHRGRSERGGGPPVSRPELIRRLDADGLLPAIDFIFSRAGCDAALAQCRRSGLDLLGPERAAAVDEVVDRFVADLAPDDRDVLGVDDWRTGLRRGFAAHHAGMLPAFRHAVEELFVRGLVQMVFATETLALGINMPARSVVLERLVKYNGEAHVDLTPGEFTQLTGRAGRRGIDIEGHAVVVFAPGMQPAQVAGLAGARTFPLRSSFAPEYNMAVNLIRRVGLNGSRELLDRSFAQFQADKSVVGQSRQIDAVTRKLRKLDVELEELAGRRDIGLGGARAGDATEEGEFAGFLGYMRLRELIRTRERELKFEKRMSLQNSVVEDLFALKRGQVIGLFGGRHRGLAVVLEPASDRRDPKPLVLVDDAWAGRVGVKDFLNPPEVLGNLRLAKTVDRRTGRGRRDLASALRSSGIELPRRKQSRRSAAADDNELVDLRRQLRAHPAHGLPDHDELFRAAERRTRLVREIDALEQSIADRTATLRADFDRIVAILEELGYLVPGPDGPTVAPPGDLLTRIYSESDLLICECLRSGVWDGLQPPELAGVVAAVVYESRRDAFAGPDLAVSVPPLRTALVETHRRWRDLSRLEMRHSLDPTREPDAGFSMSIHLWASGRSLPECLAVAGDRGRPLPAGDFVRWSRQVIDLLEQIRIGAGEGDLARTARRAVSAIRRGVVAVELG